ncbi:MAG: aminotransferase class IV [Aquificaceae bacterium]|jgi:4-amino-4-deoxychorismate lyase|uniref:aminotransferase class IV n=1 Tax=Hydrogenobacter sp. Uz 6-8 TaxID=3384828 RepID=UPI000F0EFEB3|nr:MAG: aminodeoxychorismate lyase [Aquificota bacterium]
MTNRTLLFGEGLFETIRWRPSEEKLRLHYERLSSSAGYLGIPCPTYEEFIRDLLQVAGSRDGLYLKYLLISKGGDFLTDRPSSHGTLIIAKSLKPAPLKVRLCLSSYRRHSSDPVCRHKTTSYLFNLLVKREAKRRGYWDGVVLNERGHTCETSTANLLFLKGSRLYTPARECGLLWGTTLEFLSRRLEVREEYLELSALKSCDSLFVLNSLVLCAAVEEMDGERLRVDRDALEEINRILKASQ